MYVINIYNQKRLYIIYYIVIKIYSYVKDFEIYIFLTYIL